MYEYIYAMVKVKMSICNDKYVKIHRIYVLLREDTHKKSVILVVGPLGFYPPYSNGLVVHATFFF